ncbi:MAG: SRPBCC domain-containing protein [Myxococcales bacterium]|nr:SRPBCC domain-containing protein [Myxococcales bacterium]MBK7192336.1 SRPBCC domain-containing protein [Myxococcales bacterium]MBP6844308.1 SRPBCC domain-containing protein [Kofleriaceae bacterium]
MIPPAATGTTIDHQTFTITFERTFVAPPEDVFDAWTQPAHLTRWWDPTGTPLASCRVDLRPGGAFEFVNQAHSPPFAGTYRVIERPARLEFDALGAAGTVSLTARDGATHMRVTIRCASAEHLAQFLQHGVDVGTAKTLDNLVAHLRAARAA